MTCKPHRIEIHAGPNRNGAYHFTVFWMADYHPGHPLGENRWAERGQGFLANPDDYGPREIQVNRRVGA